MAQQDDDTAASSELLRLTVPLMSKHGCGFSPISYAVWYEYVRGANLELKSAVDTALQIAPKLSFAQTHELHQVFIADKAEKAIGETKAGFIDLMGRLNGKIADAGDGTTLFCEHLATFQNKLDQSNPSPLELKSSVGELSSHVTTVEATLLETQKELIKGHVEIQKLTDELKRAREESLIDPLSQLKNRRAFELALADLMADAAQTGEPFSAIIFDIDYFKRINDNYGHLFGDTVIKIIAQVLNRNVKGKDIVARYGGEEFIVLLPDTNLEGACAVANRIRGLIEHGRIKKPHSTESIDTITISAGVSQFVASDDRKSFVERADQALYSAKASGRNKVCSVVESAQDTAALKSIASPSATSARPSKLTAVN